MNVTITITAETSAAELHAYAALIATLGGRAGATIDRLYNEMHAGDPVMPELAQAAIQPAVASLTGTVSAVEAPAMAVPAPPISSPAAGPASIPSDSSSDAPVPLPVPPAPVAVVPPPPVSSGAAPASPVETDSAGLPWDARIHGEKRATNADGTWRKRRNTPDALVAQVEAELRAVMTAQPGTPYVAPVPAPPSPAPDPNVAFAPTASPEAVVTVAAEASGDPFNDLLTRVVQRQVTGQVSAAQVAEAARMVGLPSIRDLQSRPDLIGAFETALG